jgi:hypothetical protein
MWTTLALLSAMSYTPAQAGQLKLENVRFTYGIHGQERKDSNFLPGDMAFLAFDIDGLKVKDDGIARYSMSYKLHSKKKGKSMYEREATEYEVKNSLGGSRHPVFMMTNLALPDMEPGDYSTIVEIKDVLGNTSAKVERPFTLKPLEFGIVRVGFVYIPDQAPPNSQFTTAPPLAVPGQNLMLHFATVGCQEGGEKNMPKVAVKAEIQDSSGNPVVKTPITGKGTTYEGEDLRKLKFIAYQVPILVNRAGKYKIVLSATDENSGKTTTLPALDFTSIEVK